MKHTHKINELLVNDLNLLIRKLDLTRRYDAMLALQNSFGFGIDDESFVKFRREQSRLYARERSALKKWKKIPKKRRDRATDLYRLVLNNANIALKLGGNEVGKTDRKIIWRGKADAKTIQKSDVDGRGVAHIVRLETSGVVLMEKVPKLLSSSAEKGLPVISIFRAPNNPGVFRAMWVTNKAGKIKGVEGWIAYDSVRNLSSHSTTSIANAKESLRWIVAASQVNRA